MLLKTNLKISSEFIADGIANCYWRFDRSLNKAARLFYKFKHTTFYRRNPLYHSLSRFSSSILLAISDRLVTLMDGVTTVQRWKVKQRDI